MWTVKDPYLIKQKDRNPAACPFFNFRAQFNEETLNIAPLNIAARRPRKNQFNNPLMPSFHFYIVPFSGTENNSLISWCPGNKLRFDLSGLPKAGPLEGGVCAQHGRELMG
jgi:hypothetical protein